MKECKRKALANEQRRFVGALAGKFVQELLVRISLNGASRERLLKNEKRLFNDMVDVIAKYSSRDHRFSLLQSFELIVPGKYNHFSQLINFSSSVKDCKLYYDRNITDGNYKNVTRRLRPRQRYGVKFFKVNKERGEIINFIDCLDFLEKEGAVFVGAQGLSLVFEAGRGLFPTRTDVISLDKIDNLWGYHACMRFFPVLYYNNDINSCCASFELKNTSYSFPDKSVLLCVCEMRDFY